MLTCKVCMRRPVGKQDTACPGVLQGSRHAVHVVSAEGRPARQERTDCWHKVSRWHAMHCQPWTACRPAFQAQKEQ